MNQSTNQLEKSIDTIDLVIYCKSCFEKINATKVRNIIEKDVFICDECISKINPNIKMERIDNNLIYFLVDNSSILYKWLNDYKNNSDCELSSCFLYLFKPFIKVLSLSSILIPIPVCKNQIDKNEYSYINLMLESADIKYQDVLQIDDDSFLSNGKDKNISVSLKDDIVLENKRIILFSDVIDDSDLFFKCMDLLKGKTKKKVTGLVLIDTRNIKKGLYQ